MVDAGEDAAAELEELVEAAPVLELPQAPASSAMTAAPAANSEIRILGRVIVTGDLIFKSLRNAKVPEVSGS